MTELQKFYAHLLRKLQSLPESDRLLLSGDMHGKTSDSKKPCHCVVGLALPPEMPLDGMTYLSARLYREEVKAWFTSLGIELKPGDDASGVMMLQQRNDMGLDQTLGIEDSLYVTPRVYAKRNTESACRARYTMMVQLLINLVPEAEE